MVWPRNIEAGRLVVIISSLSGFEVLDAMRQNGRMAVNVTLPENFSSMSFIGSDAVVSAGGAAFRDAGHGGTRRFASSSIVTAFPRNTPTPGTPPPTNN